MSRIRKKIEEIHFDKENNGIFIKILKPVSYLYNGVAKIRREIYSKRLLKSRVAGCFTIAVGNLTYGGTGKTPVVINLAGMFSERGLRVGIVHSGYGSLKYSKGRAIRVMSSDDGPDVGDEAAELFVRAKDALVYSSRNREEAIEKAIYEGGVNVCILDDAFQYMKIFPNLKILVVDFYDQFGNEYCLPAGPMRESRDAISDADIIWFVSPGECKREQKIEEEYLSINSSLKFIYSQFSPEYLVRLRDMEKIDISSLKGKVVSFSGIGRDKRFTNMLSSANISIERHLSFEDHHRYRKKDIENINSMAEKHGADTVITTEKDYLRDTKVLSQVKNLHILRVYLKITDGMSELEKICGIFS